MTKSKGKNGTAALAERIAASARESLAAVAVADETETEPSGFGADGYGEGGFGGGDPGDDQVVEISAEQAEGVEAAAIPTREIALGRIEPDPGQPRRLIDPAALDELAASLRAVGQLQAASVYWWAPTKRYRLISGERRWRAARLAKLKSLRCEVLPTPPDAVELRIRQYTENEHRAPIGPVEEARFFSRLIQDTKWSGEELARRLGITAGKVSKALAILRLPTEVLLWVEDGSLAPTTAYELARGLSADQQFELAERAVAEDLSRDAVATLARPLRQANAIANGEVPAEIEGDSDTSAELAAVAISPLACLPPPPTLQRFAIVYPGHHPAYHLLAVSREAAIEFARIQHPPGWEFDAVPAGPRSEAETGPRDQIAPAPGYWFSAAEASELIELAQSPEEADPEDFRKLRRLRAWAERTAAGDSEPAWGRWEEFAVDLAGVAGAVRVLIHGHSPSEASRPDYPQGVAVEFLGPIASGGRTSRYVPQKDAERARQIGPRAYAAELAAEMHAASHRNIIEAFGGRYSWHQGAGRYNPINPAVTPGHVAPASTLDFDDDADDDAGTGSTLSRERVDAPCVSVADQRLAGWEEFDGLTPYYDERQGQNWQIQTRSIAVEMEDGDGPAELVELLGRALVAARFRLGLTRIPIEDPTRAAGTARPGDNVQCQGSRGPLYGVIAAYDPGDYGPETETIAASIRLPGEPAPRTLYFEPAEMIVVRNVPADEPEAVPTPAPKAKARAKKGGKP